MNPTSPTPSSPIELPLLEKVLKEGAGRSPTLRRWNQRVQAGLGALEQQGADAQRVASLRAAWELACRLAENTQKLRRAGPVR